MTMTQPAQPGFAPNTSNLATGGDIGAGLSKICIGRDRQQMKIRVPSKIVEIREELADALFDKEGGFFQYVSGDREDLVGQRFLVGSLAALKAPTSHIKLSDNPALKAEYCLHILLGALATVPYRQTWNLHLILSTHNKAVFQDAIARKIQGTHVVSFGGNIQSRINLKLSLIVPEGVGSYSYCVSSKPNPLIDKTSSSIAFDLGTSTTIATVFAPGGSIVHRKVLEIGGCIDLLELIASDAELIQFLGTGKSGSVETIRQGIESRDFQYGTRNFNFRPIYARHIKTWLSDRVRLALKEVEEWRNSSLSFVAWGGGVELPGVAKMLSGQGINAVPEGCWANAIGLQRIAEGRLQIGK